MSKVITGTNAADNLTVWESGVTVNAGAGDDTIHLKKGTGSTVNAEAGNDTIYVHAGTHTVYGGAGDDIMVTWANAGNGSRFEGGAGNNSVKIKGGNNHTIVMGDGTLNTVNLDKGSGHKITGGDTGVDRLFICSNEVTNVEADLKNGENRATMWGGITNSITGGADVDIFNVKGGSQNKLYGGAGKDYLIIHEGKQNHVYGGAGDDRLTVWHKSGDKNYLYGEDGNDTIEINGGNEHEIDGGDGYNTVKLKGGNKHTYTGGSGKDIIYISGGNGHTVTAGDGTNKITVYSGTGHTITGGKDNDTIIVSAEARGVTIDAGAGSDYINITGSITASTDITIYQDKNTTKDKDTLILAGVKQEGLDYGLSNNILTLAGSTGGTITIPKWNNASFANVVFSDGTTLTSEQITELTEVQTGKELNWTLGNQTTLTVEEIGDKLQINGYNANDFVITKNESGNLFLTDVKQGKIMISGWPSSHAPAIEFVGNRFTNLLTGNQINAQAFHELVLSNPGDGQSNTYNSGVDTRQEFKINFTTKTNVVINSVNGAEDRIKFTDNHSVDDVDFAIQGNDLYLYNWSQEENKRIDGLVVIKDFKNSTVKTLEFKEMTYHLIGGGDHTFVGSDTFIDRYLFLDTNWSGTDRETGDWNVTVDGINGKDVLDFHFLPNNSRYYNLLSSKVGKDMVLTYQYATDPHNSATLGTVRLKDFYNEDGSINTANGYPRVRTNREVYAGSVSESAWDGWVWNRDKQYRWLSLNAGTSGEDSIDLRNVARPTNTKAWMYFAGGGNDTVTAQEGDIVYGGKGDDTVYVTGSWTDVHGGSGEDRITVQGAGGENLHHVVVRGDADKDVITAFGSYHYLHGGSGDDEINLRDDGKGNAVSQNNAVSGGNGDDTISIYAGKGNRINGAAGNDTISIYAGNGNRVNGGAGNDRIVVRGGAESRLDGGIGTDIYSVEMDFNQNTHILIDQAGFVEGDTDILKLTKVIQSDMQFFLQNNVLKVAHVSGGSIEILGWNVNPLEKIYFADGEITAAGINEKTNI